MSQMPGTFSRVRLCCGHLLALLSVLNSILHEGPGCPTKWGAQTLRAPAQGRHLLEPLPTGDLHFPIVLQRDDKDRFVIRALQKFQKILLSSKIFCKVSKLCSFT